MYSQTPFFHPIQVNFPPADLAVVIARTAAHRARVAGLDSNTADV